MKKIAALLALLMLLLCACGTQQPAVVTEEPTEATEPATEAPTTQPEPTEPDWQPGIARAAWGELVYCTLDAGTEVTVIGESGDYYVIQGDEVDLLIEKIYLRTNLEEPFEERPGYGKWNTPVYDNPYFERDPIAHLMSNQKVTVLEGNDHWLHIQWDDGSGYVKAEQINNHPYTGGGGSGGGNNDGSDVPMGSLAAPNPHVSQLGAYFGPEQTAGESVSARVLIPDARAYLTLTRLGSEVKVTYADETLCSIYLEGYEATTPRWLLRLEEDERYESWSGFARYGAKLYKEYQLRNAITDLRTNTQVEVLDELPNCYVVQVGEEVGYMPLDMVTTYRSSGGGSSGGGGGGSEWTPPAM